MKKEINKGLVLSLTLIVIGVIGVLVLAKFIGIGEQVDNYLPKNTTLMGTPSSIIILDSKRVHTWPRPGLEETDSLYEKNDSL